MPPQEPFAADKPLDLKPKLPPFEGPQHSPAAAKGDYSLCSASKAGVASCPLNQSKKHQALAES